MPGENTTDIDEYREYLNLLGRMQLDDKLAGKVDVSGVVQMTLLEASQAGWDRMETDQRVTWLRRIFANNLLDEIRRFRTQARDVDRERSIEEAMQQSASRVNEWLAGEQSSPSTKAARSEEALRLAKAMACLPVAQRRAIELHHLQRLPLDEISRKLDRNKGAIAALIYRGTTRLRELLNTGGTDESL